MTYAERPVNDYWEIVGTAGQLVDVREPAEVAQGSLPGAINIPLAELPSRIDELDRSRRVVLLCRSGGRSANAAALLVGCGFTDVVNLSGGMLAVRTSD